jgi:hypothetical protein
MSTNLADRFIEESAHTLEESWEEAFVHSQPEPYSREASEMNSIERFLDELEPTKTYRIVFNRRADSVRLEPQTVESKYAAPDEDRLSLDPSISEAIESSRRILSLEDNWDEEGSIAYRESTWTRATHFIQNVTVNHWRISKSWVIPPRILPGPEGSIDIHWRTPGKELLINVPADEDISAGYYGSGNTKDTIKGKLDTSLPNLWILAWLLQ